MKMSPQLTIKEREKIYFAADLVQKHYLELQKDSDVNLDQMIDIFIMKDQKLNTELDKDMKGQQ